MQRQGLEGEPYPLQESCSGLLAYPKGICNFVRFQCNPPLLFVGQGGVGRGWGFPEGFGWRLRSSLRIWRSSRLLWSHLPKQVHHAWYLGPVLGLTSQHGWVVFPLLGSQGALSPRVEWLSAAGWRQPEGGPHPKQGHGPSPIHAG